MKKTMAVLISAAMLLALAAGCGNKENGTYGVDESGNGNNDSTPASVSSTADTQDNASKEPTLGKTTFTVGFDAEFPPYGYQDDNGEYIGFDLDLADEVCISHVASRFLTI